MNNYLKKCLLLLCLLVLGSCGSGGGDDGGSTGPSTQLTSVEGTRVELTTTFSTQMASSDGATSFNMSFSDFVTVPLYIQSNGIVSIIANEFEKLVTRVCDTASTRSDCDSTADIDMDVDIVMDSCGNGVDHSGCGENDSTVYTGSLGADGTLRVNAIAIRIRVFAITDTQDGNTASATDTGLMPDLERIVASVTTGTVSSGNLSATGSPVQDLEITLVSAGVVPSSMPELGGYSYLATMSGGFDTDPLALLE